MLWQMSGNCLTGLIRRIRGSGDNVIKQFSGCSVFEHYSARGQDLQAMRELFNLDMFGIPGDLKANV